MKHAHEPVKSNHHTTTSSITVRWCAHLRHQHWNEIPGKMSKANNIDRQWMCVCVFATHLLQFENFCTFLFSGFTHNYARITYHSFGNFAWGITFRIASLAQVDPRHFAATPLRPKQQPENAIHKMHTLAHSKTLSWWWCTRASGDQNNCELTMIKFVRLFLYFSPFFLSSRSSFLFLDISTMDQFEMRTFRRTYALYYTERISKCVAETKKRERQVLDYK